MVRYRIINGRMISSFCKIIDLRALIEAEVENERILGRGT